MFAVLLDIFTNLLVIRTCAAAIAFTFYRGPATAAIRTAIVATEITSDIPSYINDAGQMIIWRSRFDIKILIYVIVPMALTAPIALGFDAVVAILGMQYTFLYSFSYISESLPLQDILYAVMIEIAQHVGISGTAGLDIAAEIDV
jgi:hypothetical protein